MSSALTSREPEVYIVTDDTPGRTKTIHDLVVGDVVEQSFAFRQHERIAFTRVANDRAPIHEDERFAHAHGFHKPIIQGLCLSTRFSRLIGMYLPGEHAILESINLKFHHPSYEDELLKFQVRVERKLIPLRVVRLSLMAKMGEVIHISGEAQCLIR